MNNIIPFSFESHTVRVVIDEQGDPWFVASDLCKAIGLSDHKGSYKHHLCKLDDDERKTVSRSIVQGDPTLNMGVAAKVFVEAAGGAVWADAEIWVVSESGVYALILRSRGATKPGTVQHRFRKWVTAEVLPSIRKTGSYESKKGWQRPAAIDAAASLLRNGAFMMTVGQDGRIFLTQVRENEKFLDVSDPSDLSRLILCDMPESFLPRAAELLMKRALKIKTDDVGDLPVKEVQ